MRASEAAGNGRDIVIESGLVYAAISAYRFRSGRCGCHREIAGPNALHFGLRTSSVTVDLGPFGRETGMNWRIMNRKVWRFRPCAVMCVSPSTGLAGMWFTIVARVFWPSTINLHSKSVNWRSSSGKAKENVPWSRIHTSVLLQPTLNSY